MQTLCRPETLSAYRHPFPQAHEPMLFHLFDTITDVLSAIQVLQQRLLRHSSALALAELQEAQARLDSLLDCFAIVHQKLTGQSIEPDTVRAYADIFVAELDVAIRQAAREALSQRDDLAPDQAAHGPAIQHLAEVMGVSYDAAATMLQQVIANKYSNGCCQ